MTFYSISLVICLEQQSSSSCCVCKKSDRKPSQYAKIECPTSPIATSSIRLLSQVEIHARALFSCPSCLSSTIGHYYALCYYYLQVCFISTVYSRFKATTGPPTPNRPRSWAFDTQLTGPVPQPGAAPGWRGVLLRRQVSPLDPKNTKTNQ